MNVSIQDHMIFLIAMTMISCMSLHLEIVAIHEWELARSG